MTEEQYKAIEGLATFVCWGFPDDESDGIPIIMPTKIYLDCMDFDRPICELGVKQFIRPIMETEPPLEDNEEAESIRQEFKRFTHVLVEEAAPGIRRKRLLNLVSSPGAEPRPGPPPPPGLIRRRFRKPRRPHP
jgi:hypothetical protein